MIVFHCVIYDNWECKDWLVVGVVFCFCFFVRSVFYGIRVHCSHTTQIVHSLKHGGKGTSQSGWRCCWQTNLHRWTDVWWWWCALHAHSTYTHLPSVSDRIFNVNVWFGLSRDQIIGYLQIKIDGHFIASPDYYYYYYYYYCGAKVKFFNCREWESIPLFFVVATIFIIKMTFFIHVSWGKSRMHSIILLLLFVAGRNIMSEWIVYMNSIGRTG